MVFSLSLIALLPFAIFYFSNGQKREVLTFVYQFFAEFGASVLLFLYLFRNWNVARTGALPFLFVGTLAFAIAELCFNSSFISKSVESYRPKWLGAICYSISFLALCCFLFKYFQRETGSMLFYVAVFAIALVHFLLQYRFLLIPLNEVYFSKLPGFMKVNGYVYSVATAFATGFAVLYSLRTLSIQDHLFIQALLALLAFDFAARYQIVQHQFQMITWAQCFWAAAAGALFVILLYTHSNGNLVFSTPEPLAEWLSVRVMLGMFIFAINILLLVAILLANLVSIKNAVHVTTLLAMIFICWAISNSLALKISNDLRGIVALMPSPKVIEMKKAGLDAVELQKVEQGTFFSEVNQMVGKYNQLVENTNQLLSSLIVKNREAALGKFAVQVAHDIRSPLMVLQVLESELSYLPSEIRTAFQSAMNRINYIASSLLQKNKEVILEINGTSLALERDWFQVEPSSNQFLSHLIESVIEEKRLQFQFRSGIVIEGQVAESFDGVYCLVQPHEFRRVLSNLINNGIEAAGDNARVSVILTKNSTQFRLEVQDNGKGIPAEVLSKLSQYGETYNKEGGSGLGLYHARTSVESWGGEFKILSKVGVGTSILITLPQSLPEAKILT